MDQPGEGDSQPFANRILQELYPQIPIPFQRQPQNLTAKEEAFTKNEIARIMEKFQLKKHLEEIAFNILASTASEPIDLSEDAIFDLFYKINSEKNSNQHSLMISLDIKGAFDHLQYTSIKNSLDNLKYHSNTIKTLIDILSNRKVAINTSQGPATWNQQQGCLKAPAQNQLSGTWWPTKCSGKTGHKGCTCRHLQMTSSFWSTPRQNRKSKPWPIKHCKPSRHRPTNPYLKFRWTKLIISI
ncbi:hypothetical protein AVEN_256089-1 [Araneus ventricosus]|uniref:Uncharacterized protein n=1 Tax=Araneus ventricosus TaxID=182803 RepID=A0A4Y2D6V6_ARAVE|nr:hypothetical protein AVEN_256089-1 [Araneus ventricosus]